MGHIKLSNEDLSDEKLSDIFVSNIPVLDAFLDRSGVQARKVIDISGIPGSGRTALSLLFVAQAALPKHMGGHSARSVYVDTRGAVDPTMVLDTCKYVLRRAINNASCISRTVSTITPIDLLNNVHLYRISSLGQLIAIVDSLPQLLQEDQSIRVVVINSLTLEDYDASRTRSEKDTSYTEPLDSQPANSISSLSLSARSRISALCYLGRSIREISRIFNVAVLLITNLRQRESIFVPIIEPWTAAFDARFLLCRKSEDRNTLTRLDHEDATLPISRAVENAVEFSNVIL